MQCIPGFAGIYFVIDIQVREAIISGKRANEEWGFNAVYRSLDLWISAWSVLAGVLLGPPWVLPSVWVAPTLLAQELMNGKDMIMGYAQL